MDSRILDPPHAQFGGSLGGMVGFPYHLSHHHVYELTGHQLQSASAVPFSIDGLLNGSCAASVGNSNPLLSSGCGMNGDNQHYKLTGKPCLHSALLNNISGRNKDKGAQVEDKPDAQAEAFSSPPTSIPSAAKSGAAPERKHCSCQPVNTRKLLLLLTQTLRIPLKHAVLRTQQTPPCAAPSARGFGSIYVKFLLIFPRFFVFFFLLKK